MKRVTRWSVAVLALSAAFLFGRLTQSLPIIPESYPGYVESIDEGGYVVQPGDTLIGIARSALGDGQRWREVQELNGLDTTVLRVGQRLLLPRR